MFTTLSVRALLVLAGIRDRAAQLRRTPDAGYSTEATVVIALLAAAIVVVVVVVVVVVGIIVAKVTARANSIDLGG